MSVFLRHRPNIAFTTTGFDAANDFNSADVAARSTVSTKCFFQLRQLRRVRRSLDSESAATLVHAFVTSRIDYGNAPVSYTHLTLPTILRV